MLICIGLIAIYSAIANIQAFLPSATFHPIFWLEALADMAFGVSWAVKGQVLLKDEAEFLKKP